MHGAQNGQSAAVPDQIPVQYMIQIALDTSGGIQTQILPPGKPISRPILNMMIETAKQDLLTWLARAERAAKDGPQIEVAPLGSTVERNPKA